MTKEKTSRSTQPKKRFFSLDYVYHVYQTNHVWWTYCLWILMRTVKRLVIMQRLSTDNPELSDLLEQMISTEVIDSRQNRKLIKPRPVGVVKVYKTRTWPQNRITVVFWLVLWSVFVEVDIVHAKSAQSLTDTLLTYIKRYRFVVFGTALLSSSSQSRLGQKTDSWQSLIKPPGKFWNINFFRICSDLLTNRLILHNFKSWSERTKKH